MESFFDKNLDYLLASKGLSPEELAADLQVSINGTRIYVPDLLKISNFFGLSVDQMLKQDLSIKLERRTEIKLLILDIDGVMTDGGMYYTANGDEMKKFNTKDGRGVISYIKQGGQVGIISSGFKNEIVNSRAKTLGIQNVYVGTNAKEEVLEKWIEDLKINWSEVAFIGDDINDFAVMQKVGLSACPSDADDKIKEISDVILNKKGGQGCVREFVSDYLVEISM